MGRNVKNKDALDRLETNITGKPAKPVKAETPVPKIDDSIANTLRDILVSKKQERESLAKVLQAIADKPIPVPHVTVTQEAALPHSWLFRFKRNAHGQTTHVLAKPQRESD